MLKYIHICFQDYFGYLTFITSLNLYTNNLREALLLFHFTSKKIGSIRLPEARELVHG